MNFTDHKMSINVKYHTRNVRYIFYSRLYMKLSGIEMSYTWSVAGMVRKLSDLWPVHCPLRVLSPWIFQVVFQKLVLMHTTFKPKVLKKRLPLVGMIRWYFSPFSWHGCPMRLKILISFCLSFWTGLLSQRDGCASCGNVWLKRAWLCLPPHRSGTGIWLDSTLESGMCD